MPAWSWATTSARSCWSCDGLGGSLARPATSTLLPPMRPSQSCLLLARLGMSSGLWGLREVNHEQPHTDVSQANVPGNARHGRLDGGGPVRHRHRSRRTRGRDVAGRAAGSGAGLEQVGRPRRAAPARERRDLRDRTPPHRSGSSSRPTRSALPRASARPLAMGGEALGQEVDEAAHLGRQVVAVRKDRFDPEFDGPPVGQEAA